MKKIFILIVVLLMLIPFTVVNAATKTEEIVEDLRDFAKSFNGTVKYEDDTIEIEWNTPNSKSNEISFSYNGSVIEYSKDEISSYEEAEDTIAHYIYMIYLMKSTLKLNGYSEEEINEFFNTEGNEFDYDRNGIEMKRTGEDRQYTSSDGTSKLTAAPMSLKLDVTKANLSKPGDEPVAAKTTTIQNVIDSLQSDSDFTSTEIDGKVVSENEITDEDETIKITNTYYWDDYHNVSFSCIDDVITYETDEINNYEEAEREVSHQLFVTEILSRALKLNGYTSEQIEEFASSEDNEFDYDRNGIEIKELGETKEYTSSDGSSKVNISPISIKIDLNKANLNMGYKVLEGANQTITSGKELSFRFNIEYSKFTTDGKVYIDGELVDSANYTSKEGSTIITFNSNYVKTLSTNEHTLKVTVGDGEVETNFTVANPVNNPQTGDNILFYIFMLGFSIVGFVATGLYIKRKFN